MTIHILKAFTGSEFMNQQFRPARRMAGGFAVNPHPEPLNPEPVNGYIWTYWDWSNEKDKTRDEFR